MKQYAIPQYFQIKSTYEKNAFPAKGREIQPLACQDENGEKGVCMFAMNCVKTGGAYLGPCIGKSNF